MRSRCVLFAMALGLMALVALPVRADDGDKPKDQDKPAAKERDKEGKKTKERGKRAHRTRGPARPSAHHRGGDPFRHIMLARFDADRDGKLSDEEWAAVRKKFEESADGQASGDRGGKRGESKHAHRGHGDRHRRHAHAAPHRGRHGHVGGREFAHRDHRRGGPGHAGPRHHGPPPHHVFANRGDHGPRGPHGWSGPRSQGPPHARPGHGPHSEAFRQAMLKRIDKDGDGKISDEEREAARKAFHANFRGRPHDGDKDGDAKDGDRGREHARRRGPGGPRGGDDGARAGGPPRGPHRGGPPQRFGGPPRDREAARAEFMKRFDKDGDGNLSDEERQAVRKAFEEHRRGRGDRRGDDDKKDKPDHKDDDDGKDGDRRDDG